MKEALTHIDGKWELTVLPNEEVVKKGFAPCTLEELAEYGAERIAAHVPGNFELDLYSAGLVPDPYYSQNAWEFQKYENRHLWYGIRFYNETAADKNTFLRFEGIDTFSEIYLNGKLIGKTENMFIPYEFNLNGRLIEGENQLLVHIIPTMIYARRFELKPINNSQTYSMPALPVRKAAHMFGWDIMPRFVSGGIWRPVSIVKKPEERLEQVYIFTTSYNKEKNRARLHVFFELHTEYDDLSELSITVEGRCGESEFCVRKRPWHTYDHFNILLEAPKLWFPKNAGEQNLYDVTVRLERKGELCDVTSFCLGVRTVELVRTSVTDKEQRGEFVFKINGRKIFCMGTNWVPMDAFPSRHDEYLERALRLADDVGCNMLRCWGGSIYETDEFYDFCDRKGIMVWQDFCMGCAVYPQDEKFANRLYAEAVSVIKRLRSHTSLVLWAGDNECDEFYAKSWLHQNPNLNAITRELLATAVREYDASRPYLPSSPYIDDEAFATKKHTPEEHLWGPRDYFKGDYYVNGICSFASEIGYHGCPSPRSLEKFIAPDKLWPIFDEKGNSNDDWICHAAEMQSGVEGPYSYRIRLMANQVETMFSGLPNNLDAFARQSQISQAEAKKYFIEKFRIGKWERTGIIWWNLIDGWPQISDAVVDWYGCKKLAYNYIKRSQAPLCLMFDEPCDGKIALYAVNDTQKAENACYKATDTGNGRLLAEGRLCIGADASMKITDIAYPEDTVIYIEWETDSGVKGANHYTTATKGISYEKYMKALKQIGFDEFEGF